MLREKGAASVYFQIKDPSFACDYDGLERDNSPLLMELDTMILEQLEADGVCLTAHPYSTPVSTLDFLILTRLRGNTNDELNSQPSHVDGCCSIPFFSGSFGNKS
jgi:hypothetical protein